MDTKIICPNCESTEVSVSRVEIEDGDITLRMFCCDNYCHFVVTIKHQWPVAPDGHQYSRDRYVEIRTEKDGTDERSFVTE